MLCICWYSQLTQNNKRIYCQPIFISYKPDIYLDNNYIPTSKKHKDQPLAL